MNTKEFIIKYGLDGPLEEYNENDLEQKAQREANLKEMKKRQKIRWDKLQRQGYVPKEIISPMTGTDLQHLLNKQGAEVSSLTTQIYEAPKVSKRPAKSYNSIDEYINEEVKIRVRNRKIQKYRDYSIYFEGENITGNVNSIPVDFEKKQAVDNIKTRTIIPSESLSKNNKK